MLGSLLQIKPILYLSNGKVDVLEKARGTKAALETIFEVGDRECQARGLSQAVVVKWLP